MTQKCFGCDTKCFGCDMLFLLLLFTQYNYATKVYCVLKCIILIFKAKIIALSSGYKLYFKNKFKQVYF